MTDSQQIPQTPTPLIVPPTPGLLQRLLNAVKDLLSWEKMRSGSKSRFLLTLGGLVCFFFWLIAVYWSIEPDPLDVVGSAKARADSKGQQVVTGYVTTNALIDIANTLYDKQGGYLSNDVLPPGVLMDNMPNWEFGVLQQVRDFTKVLRNEISRTQTLDEENADLALAEPHFNVHNDAWLVPAAENEYGKGVEAIEAYLDKIADPGNKKAQFFTRADNLTDWLKQAARRLGSLSKRLNASVGEIRENTDLAGAVGGKQSTEQDSSVYTKTSWMEIDDVFYEARGTAWALLNLLRAIEVDYADVLKNKNALSSLQQIIRELESTQRTLWSPMILNGSDFGLFANHSLVMSAYISRVGTGMIELRELLIRG